MCKAKRFGLLDIRNPGVPPVPNPHRLLDFGARIAHHDSDVRNARRYQIFYRIKQYRLVSHRHKLLGARISDRPQPRPLASAKYKSLHKAPLMLKVESWKVEG